MSGPSMTRERFARIREIYLAASKLDGGEQDAFVSGACAGDPALETDIRDLLALGDPDDRSLEEVVAGVARGLADTMEHESTIEAVGPYRILKTIGRGGMGRVYLAERADGHFRHRVAIKVVDGNRSTPELVSRFRSERQILASLDHPNIARLFDGGETVDGVPYLVMEYVDGVPVDDYCDTHRLSIRERLELFVEICRTIEYAHRNLVVHRDIKPSNILITAEGMPKLLDFGIAKLLGRKSIDYTMAATVGDVRLMTPRNASPEQIRGEAITTATDIYSLGLLLYQLLCGRFPYQTSGTQAYELERLICETDPARPSAAINRPREVQDAAATPESITTARRVPTTAQLRRHLSGDLDNIVLVAMRKEPERRYATVRQLADDVRNHLEHKPVAARGDSLAYRTAKFLRRNPVGVVTAILALVVISSLVSYYTWQLAEQRDRALTEARIASRVSSFLVTLFDAANPALGNPDEITPKTLLDRGRERIDVELVDAPEIRARLIGILSEGYRVLGDYETSRPMAMESLELTEGHRGDEIAIAAARTRVARNLVDAGQWDEARVLFDEALPVLRAAEAHAAEAIDLRALAGTLLSYGNLLRRVGEADAAEAMFRDALTLAKDHDELPTYLQGSALGNIGILMGEQSRPTEQIKYLEQAAAIYLADPSVSRYQLAALQNSLGNAYRANGRAEEAVTMLDASVEGFVEALGQDHQTVAKVLLARSGALKTVGRIEEAGADIIAARTILRNTVGPHHPEYAMGHHYLATHYWRFEQRLDEAYELYGQALEIYREALKPDHAYIVFALNAQGGIRNEQGRFEEARTLLEEGLSLARSSMGPDHEQIRYANIELGKLHHRMGNLDLARQYFDAALEYVPRDGSRVDSLELLLESYAALLDDLGESAKAEAFRKEAAGQQQ